jgi:hypothetical protein
MRIGLLGQAWASATAGHAPSVAAAKMNVLSLVIFPLSWIAAEEFFKEKFSVMRWRRPGIGELLAKYASGEA